MTGIAAWARAPRDLVRARPDHDAVDELLQVAGHVADALAAPSTTSWVR
jgi:hypothetical protein